MLRLSLVAGTLAAFLAAEDAAAQVFSQVDRNRDGVISWEEARRAFPFVARVHFDRCDRSRSGTLNFTEFHCLRSINEMLDPTVREHD